MRVVVLGAGAVGSLLGARLAAAGSEVVLVGRPDHVRAIVEKGLVVEGEGSGTFRLEATDRLASVPVPDACLLATKTFDLERAAGALGRAYPPLPTLLIQNGLGVHEIAVAALGAAGWPEPALQVVRAVQSVPVTLLGPGRIRATGRGEIVLSEAAPAAPARAAIALFLRLLGGSGIPLRTTDDLDREVWRKLLVNAAINPVTALHGVTNGALLDPPLRDEALRLLEEARRVAELSGVRFARGEAVAEFERVARATATNRSSMLQDVDRGRPTEVDAILGEIVRRGAAHGLRLPATEGALVAVNELVSRGAQPL